MYLYPKIKVVKSRKNMIPLFALIVDYDLYLYIL